MKKLLKVLNNDLESPFQHYAYVVGEKLVCDHFDLDKNNDCSRGFYATDWDGLSYSYRAGSRVFWAECSGKEVEVNPFKRRYEEIKLTRELTIEEIKEGLSSASESAGYDLLHVSFPVNPCEELQTPTLNDISLLKHWVSVSESVSESIWGSVWGSVRDSLSESVWGSVRDSLWESLSESVWDSVRRSVRDSVRGPVWESVRGSVWAYTSSLFPNIAIWDGIDHEPWANPFQPCIDLWIRGFVPSFDGEKWRLHSGPTAQIVYEMEVEDDE